MLEFFSSSVRIVNSERAAQECIEVAFPNGNPDNCRAILFNATLGHKLDKVAAAIQKILPSVPVFGASGCGVTGREGVGESMNELAIMAVCGTEKELSSAAVDDIYGHNSYEKGLELARQLKNQTPNLNVVYLLCSGIDIDNALVLKAFVDTFGEEVTVFGGTSSDNMRGLRNYQYHGDKLGEHDAWAIGFADPTLKNITRATHGFMAYGEPLVITKAEGNRIFELNGRGAWSEYTQRLSKPAESTCGDTIPTGALAEELPPELANEYGNPHILRVITKHDGDTMYYPVTCKEGTRLWLTLRDENLIFSEQQRSLEYLQANIGNGKPVAVFQTDCLARGRFLFNRVVKDEIISMMHNALTVDGVIPPWLGNYGFGEYTRLGGKNAYHN
ncbi:MAG: FIST C-terminal domain-containing protein, partial [Planctomycetaceae bacterium]|nr:FIST C-terminal domain-containing protein [Planctomycetaceae bacterium]